MVEQEHKRYPGTRPFRDDKFDRMLFKGRSKEIQQLLHLILAENLVVLFAKSGVGKSSLLNAGVFQPLREKNYFPIRIRMNDPDSDFIEVIDDEAKSVAKDYNIDATLKNKNPESESLWQYFKTAEFWSQDDTLLTPVLVFDQFEEIFTLGYTQEQRKNFFLQLADLVLGRTPESYKINKAQGKKSYSEKPPNIKVVISMREDFLAELEEIATDIPSILRNRFRLQALTLEQAREAIEEPARLENEDLATKKFSYDENAVSTILKFLNRRETLSDLKSEDHTRFWSWKILGILALIIVVFVTIIRLLNSPSGFFYISNEALYVAFVALCIYVVTFIIFAIIRPINFVSAFLKSFVSLFIVYWISLLIIFWGETLSRLLLVIAFYSSPLIFISLIVSIISWLRLKRKLKKTKIRSVFDTNSIEPFQLQLLCQHIEEKILPGLKIDPSKLQIVVEARNFQGEEGIQKILADFYNNKVKELKSKRIQKAVRKLCEKGLISPTERRLPLAEESIRNQYNLPIEILNQLIESRLLRKEPKLGSSIYEICHDSMIQPILETAKQRKRKRIKFGMATVGFVAVIVVGFIIYNNIQSAQMNDDRKIISLIDENNSKAHNIILSETMTIADKRTKLDTIKKLTEFYKDALHDTNYQFNVFNVDFHKILSDKEAIDNFIPVIDSIYKYYAIIADSNDFIIDSKFPPISNFASTYSYSPGTMIYGSAKVTNLRRDSLSLSWKESESGLTDSLSYILNKRDSTIYFKHSFDLPGRYEFLLKNSQNYLIGRRTFYIVGGANLLNDEAIAIINSDSMTITKKLNKLKDNRTISKNVEVLAPYIKEQNILIDKKLNELVYVKTNYASIQDSGDFVVCENVQNLNPIGIKTIFIPGRVYVWARIRSPRDESIRIEWLDSKSGSLRNSSYGVSIDIQGGYRIYDSQTFIEAGNYEVRLYNSANYLIGRKVFRIEAYTRAIKK